MKPETESILQRVFNYWDGKFAEMHEKAQQAMAKHDEVEAKLEASMERRRVASTMEP